MKVVLSNDRGGYGLKEAAAALLKEQGHQVIDLGTQSPDEIKGYTDAGVAVAKAVQSGEADRGLLFCGTGMGVSQTANKFKGVYAAVVESVFAARSCRQINNCNVMCCGGYILGEYMAREMVDAFINTGFTEGFAPERAAGLKAQFARLQEIEAENLR
ncbi:RpiB/LacA/LacB family sugar-phosphate isomerase [Zongyangia hominis]|uniref:RpiB/LacA/LacB family sugar-phosphate isomerase n=1 Tax=Zongyangia hominis TaxID=2763677 RepID=A0A926ICN2_9FIRM|nr:RpiB/LacA/LacB family sugar-phosphate isomerase [Zongyangia hominis]MBC8571397.1 RpiB/LacA/LacB family sugar-phosphate isomerase [Zongyangia hominis]